MDLFSSNTFGSHEPLASRMRPRILDEVAGQDHIIGKGRLLRRVIQADRLSSLIFYGPPGTGKTTLAQVIANSTESSFITMNAVLDGVKQLREAVGKAQKRQNFYNQKTILFVDEVHRWNKSQQDALLPWVENGTVILIGATTENPYFEVNSALVSRSRIFQLKPLKEKDLYQIADFTIKNRERGYGKYKIKFDDNALEHIISISNGDARSLLNSLELAIETTPETFPPKEGTTIRISLGTAEESIQKKVVLYDREGDYHFDTISAFIKSVRGSDPDASLYWLAKMVRAGENPRFIFRRMLISACEDIGMADPMALTVVNSAAEAFDRVGLPEGRFHLTHAALYLANAPKSNSSLGFFSALKTVENESSTEVPGHLKDGSRDKNDFGHGEGYLYPHSYKEHWIAQQYLPDGLQGMIFYNPSDSGFEAEIQLDVARKREAGIEAAGISQRQEILTFSPPDRQKERWYKRSSEGHGETLQMIRNRIFDKLHINRHDRILDINSGNGLLLWEGFRKIPEGGTWGLSTSKEGSEYLQLYCSSLSETEKPVILQSDLESFLKDPAVVLDKNISFEIITGRNIFTNLSEKAEGFETIFNLLAEKAIFSIAEVIPSRAQRLSSLIEFPNQQKNLEKKFKTAEQEIYSAGDNPLVNWDEKKLISYCKKGGFKNITANIEIFTETRQITKRQLDKWLNRKMAKNGYGRILSEIFSEKDSNIIEKILRTELQDKTVSWKTELLFLSGTKE